MNRCERPWGIWEVLDKGPMFKLKRLTINPNCSISYQYHNYRSEVWTIIQGGGIAILNDELQYIKVGDTFVVPVGMKHKVTCITEEPLIAIEVQIGEIVEEQDIVRVDERKNNE